MGETGKEPEVSRAMSCIGNHLAEALEVAKILEERLALVCEAPPAPKEKEAGANWCSPLAMKIGEADERVKAILDILSSLVERLAV